jgi:hypothetical protein
MSNVTDLLNKHGRMPMKEPLLVEENGAGRGKISDVHKNNNFPNPLSSISKGAVCVIGFRIFNNYFCHSL